MRKLICAPMALVFCRNFPAKKVSKEYCYCERFKRNEDIRAKELRAMCSKYKDIKTFLPEP